MATNKHITDIKNRIENTLEKINVEKIDFGEIKMREDINDFVLENEEELDQLSQYLGNFIDNLERSKDKIKQKKINEKLIKEINNGGEKATMIAQIFNR